MFKKTIIAFFLVILTTGCVQNYTAPPPKTVETLIQEQKERINTDNFWDIYLALESHILYVKKEDERQILEFINTIPNFREKALKDVRKNISAIDSPYLVKTYGEEIERAYKIHIFDKEQLDLLKKHYRNSVVTSIINKRYLCLLTSNIEILELPEEKRREIQKIRFHNTIDYLIDNKSQGQNYSIDLLKSIAKHLTNAPLEDINYFQEKINKKEINIRPHVMIKYFSTALPQHTKSLEAQLNLTITMDTIPKDKLLEFDIMSELEKLSPFIYSNRNASLRQKNNNVLSITIEKLAYNETIHPERVTTKRIPKYQLANNLGMFFNMPNNSTYIYDVRQSEFEISYAYELLIKDKNGINLSQKILRENLSSFSTECFNQRIKNAFGGENPAPAIVHEKLQSECLAGGDSKDINDLKKEIFNNLLAEIKKESQIKQRIP